MRVLRSQTRIGFLAVGCVSALIIALEFMVAAEAQTQADVSGDVPTIQYPIAVGAERQLFVDDVVIDSMQGLRRSFHAVAKCAANPLMVPERPWETQAGCILPMTVLRDPGSGNLRLWYGAWGKQVNKPIYMCVADSKDGLRWERPNLGLFEFNGSKDNNILREGRMFRVLFDPRDEDPAKRFKAIIRDAGFLAGYSADGLRWKTTVPVLQKAFDASSVHWDQVGEKWIASCKIWRDEKRMRGYAESRDFVQWTDIAFMLAADAKDKPTDQLYSMHIARCESVYVGLLKVFDTAADRCDIQVAFSRNARHWQRPERTPFLPNGQTKGDWDYGNLDPAGDPILVGDELWFFYSGRSTLHYESPNDGALGLAKLRRDGFASIGGPGQTGTLTTKPLVLKGHSLYVNAGTRDGALSVEILPVDGQALGDFASFGEKNCPPLSADAVRQEVRWNGQASLKPFNDKPVRLRFHVANARLYSFWTEDSSGHH